MDHVTLERMLSANDSPIHIANWLRNTFFVEIQNRFNSLESRKRFALFQGEQIPINERNLTDVRTRMGILIEFEIARISNSILEENNIHNLFWSYVIANRFPDLEIRDNQGNRHLRLEVKCLQCIAEEKSANFDTLLKDISPISDYVIVCLWDWNKEINGEILWDSAPWIYNIYVLHAYSLAKLRDTYWLNNPPPDLVSGYQGYDIRYAITCSNGVYSKEQGNYGKLTRIWKTNFQFRPQMDEILQDTENEYIRFIDEIIPIGFKILVKTHFHQLHFDTFEEINVHNNNTVGYRHQTLAYLLKIPHAHILNIARENQISLLINMTEKYRCTMFRYQNNRLNRISTNRKPKQIIEDIQNTIHHPDEN